MKNPTIDDRGTELWYNEENQLHRLDGPAFIGKDGYKAWYQNNRLHRTDGPAQTWTDGLEIWYINGKPIEPIPDLICYLRKKIK